MCEKCVKVLIEKGPEGFLADAIERGEQREAMEEASAAEVEHWLDNLEPSEIKVLEVIIENVIASKGKGRFLLGRLHAMLEYKHGVVPSTGQPPRMET
jgi:hypothetical protein